MKQVQASIRYELSTGRTESCIIGQLLVLEVCQTYSQAKALFDQATTK
jgi:hypothetical protein